jgi:SPP1 family predicted phage head-tail adaptor
MLREPVQFQQLSRVADGAGGWAEAWAAIASTPGRAMVRPLSGSEEWRFSRINATARLMVVTRYSSVIAPEHRVIIRGRTHNIVDVRNVDFGDKWLEIAVTGGVAT